MRRRPTSIRIFAPIVLTALFPAVVLCQSTDAAQQVQALMVAGIQEKAKGDFAAAEEKLRQAVELARQLEKRSWLVRSEVLKHLTLLYDNPRALPDAEEVLQERVAVIQDGAPTGPELGNALFDLLSAQAFYGKADEAIKTALHEEAYYVGPCKQTFARDRCDRKLADVEALVGGALFLAKRNDEAEVWLKRVTDREDDNVRPETMLLALRAYAAVLALRLDTAAAVPVYRRALDYERAHPQAARVVGEWVDKPDLQ